MSQQVVEHAVNTGKVLAGGAGVGITTYQTVLHSNIEQATAMATLTAAIATTVYFSVSAIYALWKWKKEANAGK